MVNKQSKSSSTLECILLAAIHCYGLYGVDETSLEQVAKQAGVSRSTIYRHAKNRRELLNKVLLRDADHALTELEAALRYQESLESVVLESILFLMRRRNNYEMQHILYGDSEQVSQGNGLSLELLCLLATNTLQGHFEKAVAAHKLPDRLTLAMLADWVSRITLSLHSQPSVYTESEASLREYLTIMLSPIFRRQA